LFYDQEIRAARLKAGIMIGKKIFVLEIYAWLVLSVQVAGLFVESIHNHFS